jgi:hypothetical protein
MTGRMERHPAKFGRSPGPEGAMGLKLATGLCVLRVDRQGRQPVGRHAAAVSNTARGGRSLQLRRHVQAHTGAATMMSPAWRRHGVRHHRGGGPRSPRQPQNHQHRHRQRFSHVLKRLSWMDHLRSVTGVTGVCRGLRQRREIGCPNRECRVRPNLSPERSSL